jgi:hypothetical protein
MYEPRPDDVTTPPMVSVELSDLVPSAVGGGERIDK